MEIKRTEVSKPAAHVSRDIVLTEEDGEFFIEVHVIRPGLVEIFPHVNPPTTDRKEAERQFNHVVAAWGIGT